MKDYSNYLFNGKVYNKRKFALAVFKKFVFDMGESLTANHAKKVFSNKIQGTNYIATVKEIKDPSRYFTLEPVKVEGLHFYVRNQWGINNIENLLDLCEQLGYYVVKI